MNCRKPPHLINSKKSTLSYSQRIHKANQAGLNRSKMLKIQESQHKKSHTINFNATKLSKSKIKTHNTQKSLMFSEYGVHAKKNSRKVTFIPQAIKFKEDLKTMNNPISQSHKRRRTVGRNDKQNQMWQNNCQGDKIIPNRQLIRTSLKPNKVNFMNRVSNVYDLMISNVMLPQFVEYFLGEAIYAMGKHDKNHTQNSNQFYDWKLDQFKQLCQKIYQNSGEEDLKYFMGLSLPNVSRWNSRPSSTKVGSTIPPTLVTTHTDSRITDITSSENRMSYFRSLNRKDRVQLGDERESIDIIDKLNSKLDNYLKNNYQIDRPVSRREVTPSFGAPVQLNKF